MMPLFWLFAAVVSSQTEASNPPRPDETSLFGDSSPTAEDASKAPSIDAAKPSVEEGKAAETTSKDEENLSGPAGQSQFDTGETKADPLKVGGNIFMNAQTFFREGQAFKNGTLSAPFILDAFMDGRPTERLRAFVQARLQYDPTRPTTAQSTSNSAPAGLGTPTVGITQSTQANPNVLLDQFWLNFDVKEKVFVTVGRQKVRWGTARIWYPTDFLNSVPRDALNPFDARLGVNMLKLHLPIESRGWNFYAYGLLGEMPSGRTTLTLEQLGSAARAQLVFGSAEISLGGVWMNGRRPRYAVDVSAPVGPVDVYAEAAFRSGKDFLLFKVPEGTTSDNLTLRQADILASAYRPDKLIVQVSGGVSWQFNYTDNNFAVLFGEYFYNPAGYSNPGEYLVQTFFPDLVGQKVDPIQSVPLYGSKHSAAVGLALPGLPGKLDWVTVNVSNIFNFGDPSGLVRLDAIFRVLRYLNVQVFAQGFYGQEGGELRFTLPASIINSVVNASPAENQAAVLEQLKPLRDPPLGSFGVLLRLSI